MYGVAYTIQTVKLYRYIFIYHQFSLDVSGYAVSGDKSTRARHLSAFFLCAKTGTNREKAGIKHEF